MPPGPIRSVQERSRKYTKSERTHEENQERAYIAASRRSDRSLEARMESARRASEIHKRRCGRSFRITEEAVLNEEMYEEEDPDYGQRVSRLYAAFAQDAALMHQQWMYAQRIKADQANSKFFTNSPTMQNAPKASPTTPSEPIPFFAYQPGAQPTSTPIRPELSTLRDDTASGQKHAAAELKQPSHPLSPENNQNRPDQFSQFLQQYQPAKQAVQSPNTLSPVPINPSGNSQQNASLDMPEDRASPYPAQLHLFTYPTLNLNGFNNTNYNYNPNFSQQFTQNSTPVPQSSISLSPNMIRSPGINGIPSSPQYFQNEITGDQFRSLSGQTLKGMQHQFTSPTVMDSVKQEKTEQAFQNMRRQMSTSYEAPHPVKTEPDLFTPFFTGEEVSELSYDDWLDMPGGSQG